MSNLRLGTLIPLLCLAMSAFTQGTSYEGTWQGRLTVNELGADILVTFESNGSDWAAAMAIPGQNVDAFPTDTLYLGQDSIRFGWAASQTLFRGTASGSDEFSGMWVTRGQGVPITFKRLKDGVYRRQQEPTGDLPYHSEEVQFASGEDGSVTLAGTLTTPNGDGPFPAVVLVSGSGAQDRDEAVYGHRPFLVLSDRLTKAGIAVLRFDDRGTAQSTGTFEGATTRDFALDAIGAVEFLRNNVGADFTSIGICGHTEGGSAGMIAATESDIDFLILLATAGVSNADLLVEDGARVMAASGVNDELIRIDTMYMRNMYNQMQKWPYSNPDTNALRSITMVYYQASDLIKSRVKSAELLYQNQLEMITSPWFHFFATFDPADYLPRVTCPVLAITGSEDMKTPADKNLGAIAALTGNNPSAKVEKLEGLNHYFQPADPRLAQEYGLIDTTFDEKTMQLISQWITELR